MTTLVKDYRASNGERFVIVNASVGDKDMVCAINKKHINRDGTLKRTLRGADVFPTNSVAATIKMVEDSIKTRALIQQGIDSLTAIVMVMENCTKEEAEAKLEAAYKAEEEANK